MTDKQITINKDKFEKAENEPINQEAVNKFIEDTNKFYIDGVDVSGCIVFNNKWGTPLCNPTEDIREAIHCSDNPNCLYKKYKRKEQECEELKEINQELLKYRKHSTTCQDCYEDGLEDGKTSNKELRKLKQTLTEIKDIAENITKLPISRPYDACILNKQIIQKLEELKVQ